jgi:hypothetical protein
VISGKGYVATFAHGIGDKKYRDSRPVVYWDSDARGVILTDDGRMQLADTLSNFLFYEEIFETTILPAPIGWWVVHQQDDDDDAYWCRALAFVVKEDGFGFEVIDEPDSGGSVFPSELGDKIKLVWHPGRQNSGNGPWPPDVVAEDQGAG